MGKLSGSASPTLGAGSRMTRFFLAARSRKERQGRSRLECCCTSKLKEAQDANGGIPSSSPGDHLERKELKEAQEANLGIPSSPPGDYLEDKNLSGTQLIRQKLISFARHGCGTYLTR